MTIEVHGTYKPSFKWRARLVPAALLLGACLLAGQMAGDRARDRLGARVRPPGWELSFRLPRGFEPGVDVSDATPNAYHLLGWTRRRSQVTVVIQRLPGWEGTSADVLAEAVMGKNTLVLPTDGHLTTFEHSEQAMGTTTGTQIRAPGIGAIVRAVVLPGGLACTMTLYCPDRLIDPDTYELFDQTCRSIIRE